ncbi:SWIM zinc finger family protein [Kineococcus terrestris]|uniref:SWIM zinc finger family protein n=1 Tax=Kineococcus terrestris TaxID=2044856 RepID=UPI0034DB7244
MSEGAGAAERWDRYARRRPGEGPALRSRRGRIARTWWSRAFVAAVEDGGHAGRLARGRTYARAGQVADLRVRAGAVTARVQGSRPRPYLVEVGVPRWTPAETEAVVAVVVANPLMLAPLFAGDVPPALVELLGEVGVDLLAGGAQVAYDCSCPDDGEPCKHAAAVVYALAERLDDDPSQVLALRGADLGSLLRRVERAASGPAPAVEDLSARTADFWTGTGDWPPLPLPEPVPGRTVADDLDEVVLGPGAAGTADALRPWYAALVRAPGTRRRGAR